MHRFNNLRESLFIILECIVFIYIFETIQIYIKIALDQIREGFCKIIRRGFITNTFFTTFLYKTLTYTRSREKHSYFYKTIFYNNNCT